MATIVRQPRPISESQPASGMTVITGTLAGVFAGALMLLFAMLAHWAIGYGFWTPPREISCVLYGPAGMLAGGPQIAVGLMYQTIVSAAWGIVFAAILPRRASAWAALWWGLVFGIGVWAVMTYGVLPWGNPWMSQRVAMLPEWFFYEHVVYGLALMVTPILRLRLSRAEARFIQEPQVRRKVVV